MSWALKYYEGIGYQLEHHYSIESERGDRIKDVSFLWKLSKESELEEFSIEGKFIAFYELSPKINIVHRGDKYILEGEEIWKINGRHLWPLYNKRTIDTLVGYVEGRLGLLEKDLSRRIPKMSDRRKEFTEISEYEEGQKLEYEKLKLYLERHIKSYLDIMDEEILPLAEAVSGSLEDATDSDYNEDRPPEGWFNPQDPDDSADSWKPKGWTP